MKTTTALKALLLAVLATGSALTAFSATLAPMSPISLDRAVVEAQRLADRQAGSQVLRVTGESMLPFFSDGAVLVVRPIEVTAVKPGMVVVYQHNDGDLIVHRIIARNVDGSWTAKGENNDRADTTRVTAANLRGVVYATLYSNGRSESALNLASLETSAPLAYAAPAR